MTREQMKQNIWTVANAVTAVKLPLAGLFPFVTWDYEWELVVLAVAGLSDFLDGRIARRMGQAGGFGAILDPVCDKVFLLTVVGTYVAEGRLPLWALGIVVLRDVYVLLAWAALILTRCWHRFEISARPLGKAVTALQFVLFGFVALELPIRAVLAVLLVFSLLACYDYTAEMVRQSRRQRQGGETG